MRLAKFTRAFLGDNITPMEPVECYINPEAVCIVEPALSFDERMAQGSASLTITGTRISTLSGSWVVQEPLASVVAALQGETGPGTVFVHIGARR